MRKRHHYFGFSFIALYMMLLFLFGLIWSCGESSDKLQKRELVGQRAYRYLNFLANQGSSTIARIGEMKRGDWIYREFQAMGYQPKFQYFDYSLDFEKGGGNSTGRAGRNILVVKPGIAKNKIIVFGTHYDSEYHSKGDSVVDNASGVAAVLALANAVQNSKVYYTLIFIVFGSSKSPFGDEDSLSGSRFFVSNVTQDRQDKIIGMLNVEKLIGGDYTYINSPFGMRQNPKQLQKICKKNISKYNTDTWIRNSLFGMASVLFEEKDMYRVQKIKYDVQKTYAFSDNLPFSCEGIPSASILTNNFYINVPGKPAGFTQTEHPEFWDCYNSLIQGPCDAFETKMGRIWGTHFDRLDVLERAFGNKIEQQIVNNTQLLFEFAFQKST